MVNLSKSKYCALWQCPKMLWLRKYKPELAEVDSHTLSIMETGNAVGDLAMGLFGDFTEVTVYTDGEIDLPAMMRRTQEEIAKDTSVICEASFEWNGLYCAVDILRREDDGWAIYEVKSSTSDEKSVYIADVAYQKFVLEHCGVKVTGTYLVVLDRDYVFDGTLDLQKLFKVYRREYKRRFAWIRAGRISDSEFYAWSEQAREQKKKCDEGSITAEDFQRWLKES